jgi:ATP-binding cassette subfamily B protein
LEVPIGAPVQALNTVAMLRAFVPFLRGHWPGYAVAIVLAVVGTGVGLLKPWPLKFLFDDVLVPGGTGAPPDVQGTLLLVVLALAGITVLDSLLGVLRGYALTAVGERVAAAVRTRLYTHMQRLSLSFHESTPTGELTTRLTGDVDKIRGLLTGTLVDAATNVLTLVGMVGVLLVLDWQLSLALLVLLPLLVLIVTVFRKRIKAAEEGAREIEGDLASIAQEALGAVKLVKSLGREEHESRRFGRQSSSSADAVLRSTRTAAGFSLTLDLVVGCTVAALVWLGAQRVLAGALTLGDLVIFTSYLRDFFGPTRALSKLSAQLARAGVRAARIVDVLRREPAVVDRPDARPAPTPRRELQLENVWFAYREGSPVLRDVDVRIPVGSSLAIVGPTGAGKSTIAALLCRLQDPTGGRVLLDGIDLRELTGESLHRQVGLVLQEAQLFRATVRENITYGRPGASSQDIEAAARVAQAHEFVMDLPQGYDTVVAERGTTLSGGQRQRLALARTVLQGCPVLVLDEPTTGLDARSEHAVLQALDSVRRERTTITITHRMAAARNADAIVVLDSGRVVESGTHEELVTNDGLYAEMCRLQGLLGRRRPAFAVLPPPSPERHTMTNGSQHATGPMTTVTTRPVDGAAADGGLVDAIPEAAPPPTGDGELGDRALLRAPAWREHGRGIAEAFDAGQLMRMLEERYDLGTWRSWERTDKGHSNVSFFVETDAGRVVLRRSHGLKTVAGAQFECGLLDHLTGVGYPAPRVVRTADDGILVEADGVVHMVMELLPGGHCEDGNRAQVAQAARGLARYHAVVADLPVLGAPARSSALFALSSPGQRQLDVAFELVAPHLGDAARAELRAGFDELARAMSQLHDDLGERQDSLTSLVIHGSYGRSALLFLGDNLSGVLDFDRSAHDLLGFDLAYALKAFCRSGPVRAAGVGMDADLCAAFLADYSEQAPLAGADLDALPLLLCAQRLVKVVKKCDNIIAKAARATQAGKDADKFAGLVQREVQRVRWLADHATDFAAAAAP